MPFGFNPHAVWSLVPVARRTVEVNTKTGFSLTAGSYSVQASSTQRGTLQVSGAVNNSAAISSVTTTRAHLCQAGNSADTAGTTAEEYMCRTTLTNSTTVTTTKGTSTDIGTVHFEIMELL